MSRLDAALAALETTDTLRYVGHVTRVAGLTIEGIVPQASIGSLCSLETGPGKQIMAEVVGLRDSRAILMPLGPLRGLSAGSPVVRVQNQATLRVGPGLLGRVLDGLGRPIDGRGPLGQTVECSHSAPPISPLERTAVATPLDLGVRAINSLMTCAQGQRISVMAGAGVGKSTLLAMMARHTQADVAIIALIGERGREVQEFVERELRLFEGGPKRVVVVAATSDEPPTMRLRGAFAATTIAEYFRDQGQRVLLMMDSVTRVAMAQREIGLSVGEPPATKGYPPSAFAVIPALLERAGATRRGSITGIYTTFIESDDLQDPIGDAVRATSDGHIVLSREIAESGIYPAIDVTKSLSRVMSNIASREHVAAAQLFRAWIRDLAAVEDLVNLGAYRSGSNPRYDAALALAPRLRELIKQSQEEAVSLSRSVSDLTALVARAESELTGVHTGASPVVPGGAAGKTYRASAPNSPNLRK